jgi:hypothetical protein
LLTLDGDWPEAISEESGRSATVQHTTVRYGVPKMDGKGRSEQIFLIRLETNEFKETRKPWDVNTSLWAPRKQWACSKELFDTREIRMKRFHHDWRRACRLGAVRAIMRHDDMADLDGDGVPDEVQEVGEVLWRHHQCVYAIFAYYACLDGSDGINSLSFNAWSAFIDECGVRAMKSKHCNRAVCDTIFVEVDFMGKLENKAAEADATATRDRLSRYKHASTTPGNLQWFRPVLTKTISQEAACEDDLPELSALETNSPNSSQDRAFAAASPMVTDTSPLPASCAPPRSKIRVGRQKPKLQRHATQSLNIVAAEQQHELSMVEVSPAQQNSLKRPWVVRSLPWRGHAPCNAVSRGPHQACHCTLRAQWRVGRRQRGG